LSVPLENLINPGSLEPVLTIDLDAVAANYRRLQALAPGSEVAGVIKANGYGCGSPMVGKTLIEEGCQSLFVATASEGASLRTHLKDVEIFVFYGYDQSLNSVYESNELIPILNSFSDVDSWSKFSASRGRPLPAALHVDTGMTRLGLTEPETKTLLDRPELLAQLDLRFVMSHLACADTPDNPMNAAQLERFNDLSNLFPGLKKSLANSAGMLIGPSYHFDLARPGIALYGGEASGQGNAPFEPVAHLHAPVLHVHEVAKNTSIGYGATYTVDRPSRIAVVGLGYADGYMRSLSNLGYGFLSGAKVPIAGRISMDLTAFDVTDIAAENCQTGGWIELLGANISVDDVGRAAGTFGYEVLTSLGHRYTQRYIRNGAVL
jgi:alanine racemase